jgi:hypothetical protein
MFLSSCGDEPCAALAFSCRFTTLIATIKSR